MPNPIHHLKYLYTSKPQTSVLCASFSTMFTPSTQLYANKLVLWIPAYCSKDQIARDCHWETDRQTDDCLIRNESKKKRKALSSEHSHQQSVSLSHTPLCDELLVSGLLWTRPGHHEEMLVVMDARLLQVLSCLVAVAGDVIHRPAHCELSCVHSVCSWNTQLDATVSYVRMNYHNTKTPDKAEVELHGFLTSVRDGDTRSASR
jgi:hypothetical protein